MLLGGTDCSLLPGFFGILVQTVLFLIILLVLVVKKKLEDRQRSTRRPWSTFLLDISKQLVGNGWLHMLNLACATLLGLEQALMSPCEWYWVSIVVDTTLGCYVEYVLLTHITSALVFISGNAAEEFRSGSYRHPSTGEFQPRRYAKQLAVWLLVVSLMKVSMLGLTILFKKPLHTIASTVLRSVLGDPAAELLVVMIVTPLFMNALQCWVVDNFIRETGEAQDREAAGMQQQSLRLDLQRPGETNES
mmetsp:Transcript_101677/g.323039  ORF Transcript_101677/g.323039 Transcript_101677/m.323039 type:complete len:248 (+) Transcript_101677:51-794(+)